MADYQNIFTQVQVRGHYDPGVELPRGDWKREKVQIFSYIMGKIGDAQIGPVYLSFFGVASLICGFIAIEIIGLNMLASVDWDPIKFIGLMPWLSLDAPLPEHGIDPMPPPMLR